MIPVDRVYKIVRKIPKGQVATYGQIAKLAGGLNPRYIGHLLHINPDPPIIPCHRVVNAKGKLAKNFALGGISEHKKRLGKEGVAIHENKVDLAKYQWKF